MSDQLHYSRLAMLEAAMLALLNEHNPHADDCPDSIEAIFDASGLSITYSRNGAPISGEGI